MKGAFLGAFQGVLVFVGIALLISNNPVFLILLVSLGVLIGGTTGLFMTRQVEHDIFSYLILGPLLSGTIVFLFVLAMIALFADGVLSFRWPLIGGLLGTTPGFFVGWMLGRNASEINDRPSRPSAHQRLSQLEQELALAPSAGSPARDADLSAEVEPAAFHPVVHVQVRELEGAGFRPQVRQLADSDTTVVITDARVQQFDQFGEIVTQVLRVYIAYMPDDAYFTDPIVWGELQQTNGQWSEVPLTISDTTGRSLLQIVNQVRQQVLASVQPRVLV